MAVALIGRAVIAQQPPCDFMTGGGYIFPPAQATPFEPTGAKGTFGAAGGCRDGSNFGHLEYQDKGTGLKVHSASITAYMVDNVTIFPDPDARLICGEATTNQCGDVRFGVRTKDVGEPGNNDEFDIQLTRQSDNTVCYSTFVVGGGPHTLGGNTGGGGNVALHKPNPPVGGSCPALAPSSCIPPGCE